MTVHKVGGDGKLDIGHVHQLIRLLTEAREIPGALPERAQYLLSGVARIVGAVMAGTVLDIDPSPPEHGLRSATVLVGWDSTALRTVEALAQSVRGFHPTIRAMMRTTPSEPGATVTATWSELVADPSWYSCEGVEHDRSPGLINAVFSSVRLRTQSHVHGLGLYREPGDRLFSEAERNLVHVFHAECEGLLHASRRDMDHDDPARSRLPPRQRQTLGLILNGLCDKEIAERLGISRYTVNQYTKAIYRHYAVTSRSQLLARLLVQPHSPYSLIVGNGVVSVVP